MNRCLGFGVLTLSIYLVLACLGSLVARTTFKEDELLLGYKQTPNKWVQGHGLDPTDFNNYAGTVAMAGAIVYGLVGIKCSRATR